MLKQEILGYLNQAITTIILIVAGLTPLVFVPLTTEFYNMPKLILLVAAIFVLLILWALKWVIAGKVVITRTPLDIPLLLLLIIVILSTFFSESRPISILGNIPLISGASSGVAYIAYILFFFIAISNLNTLRDIKTLIYIMFGTGVILSIISILSFFGIYLPISFAEAANFSPAGSSFSTAAFLVLLLPLLLSAVIAPSAKDLDYNKLAEDPLGFIKKYFKDLITPNFLIPPSLSLALLTLFGITIALIGNVYIYIVAATSLGLVLLASKKSNIEQALSLLAIPLGITILIAVWGMISVSNPTGPFSAKFSQFPREIQLPFEHSWKVAVSSFRDAPFIGTGPATHLFNYTQYKPAEVNNNPTVWNIRFDSAFNEFLQVLSTLGGLGLLALVFFAVMVVGIAIKGLHIHYEHNLSLPLSLSAILGILLLLFHHGTPTIFVAIFTVLAMLMAIHKTITGKVEELQLGIKASKLTDSNIIVGDVLPVILLIPIVVLVLVLAWHGTKVVSADYYHRQALNSASTQAIDTYNYLVKAESLNPYIDLYRVDLAQTNFALANSIVLSKGPTEASPSGSLTQQDLTNIQTLLSQSVNEAKAATTLSPANPLNWEILASIYRQIAGVAQNALAFSLESYGQAIRRDPFNPTLRLNVGGVYYSIKNYDLAIRFFTDAIVLKPDYANAYYNLSVALRDKGDLQAALQTAQQMLQLVDNNSQDYQVASAYLADLQSKVSSPSAESPSVTPPAAESNSALAKENLPDTVELGDNPEVATPPALQRRGNQVTQVSPTPTPSGSPKPTATP